VVVCLERGADLHMAQRMPLPLSVSCFSKIQIGFTFLVPAYRQGSPRQRAVKRMCVGYGYGRWVLQRKLLVTCRTATRGQRPRCGPRYEDRHTVVLRLLLQRWVVRSLLYRTKAPLRLFQCIYSDMTSVDTVTQWRED